MTRRSTRNCFHEAPVKKFALSDTSPDPYLTIDAGGTVTVKTTPNSVEIWRDGKIMLRVFAKSVTLEGEDHADQNKIH